MFNCKHGLVSLVGALALVVSATAQVQHGVIDVVENDGNNNPTSVTLTRVGGYGPWVIISSDEFGDSNRGDYVVDFGTGNDCYEGILMVGPAEDERTEPSVADPYFATLSHARDISDSNRYWIAVHHSPDGYEVNYNPALAYFPIADGWYAGAYYNSTNGGIITEGVGTVPFYNEFNVPDEGDAFVDTASGNFGLRLEGIDMRRDGVLLACGAKNEDNYAEVFVNWDGNAVINNHDNGSNGNTSEQDPVAFVFIPEGTTGVTMGRVTGSGNVLFSQGDFTVEMVGQTETNGTWRITIDGESPSTGTLLVSPYQEFGGNTIDNPVFVVPEENSWLVTSRDITGMGLQDIGAFDVAFHFAFFKNDVTITPAVPPQNYLPRLNDVLAARFDITEISPGNSNGEVVAERALGSDGLRIAGENKGDFGISWLDARPASRLDYGLDAFEGVWLGNPTEFIRDNSETGGVSGWPLLGFDNGEARTHVNAPEGGEINADFALAFFPAAAGLQQDADVQIYTGASDVVTIDGDAVNDGVCLAINWDNNSNVVTATPNGSEYLIEAWRGESGDTYVVGDPAEDWDYGYVYLPYNWHPDIVAGQVDASGNIVSGTGDFTTGTGSDGEWGFPVTTITIPGVDPQTDGVLIATAQGGAYAMSWEAEASVFEVAGIDLATQTPGQVAFSFAYIPNEIIVAEGPELCLGDMDCNGEINFDDISLFVFAIGNQSGWEATYPDCPWLNGDTDEDGDVDFDDIAIFVALIGTSCQ